jgi:mannose-6-phosphate isomerase-like protein (cupin superfamily)
MSASYTHKNVADVADSAPGFGFAETQESRFGRKEVDAERTGFTHHYFKPGSRQPFGHRHEQAEEVYFVLSGSGRMKLDDEIVELQPRDIVRVSPSVMRAFEAGDEGLEVVAFGTHHPGDGEVVQGWWSD